jgi:hypothetical protein
MSTTDAEQRLKQLESEFRAIQKSLSFPFDLEDMESLVTQSEAILADARILCSAFSIARPAWTLGARGASGK